jgi:hypothetical protein
MNLLRRDGPGAAAAVHGDQSLCQVDCGDEREDRSKGDTPTALVHSLCSGLVRTRGYG